MSESTPTRFIPVTEWDQHHPWPSRQSLRLRIHQAEHGKGDPEFLKCIHRVGGRVLIDEAAFITWVRSQNAPPDSKRGRNLGHGEAAAS